MGENRWPTGWTLIATTVHLERTRTRPCFQNRFAA